MTLALIIRVSYTPRHVAPVQPEYKEEPTFTRQMNLPHRTGTGNADSCIAWSG